MLLDGFLVVPCREYGATPELDSGHGATHEDYTKLALALNGTFWSMYALQDALAANDSSRDAFANAVADKVSKVAITQLASCQACLCMSGVLSCHQLPSRKQASICIMGKE